MERQGASESKSEGASDKTDFEFRDLTHSRQRMEIIPDIHHHSHPCVLDWAHLRAWKRTRSIGVQTETKRSDKMQRWAHRLLSGSEKCSSQHYCK